MAFIITGIQTRTWMANVPMKDKDGNELYVRKKVDAGWNHGFCPTIGYYRYEPVMTEGEHTEENKVSLRVETDDEQEAIAYAQKYFTDFESPGVNPYLTSREFVRTNFQMKKAVGAESYLEKIENSWQVHQDGTISYDTWDVWGLTGPGKGGKFASHGFLKTKRRTSLGQTWFNIHVEPKKFAVWLQGILDEQNTDPKVYRIVHNNNEDGLVQYVLEKLMSEE